MAATRVECPATALRAQAARLIYPRHICSMVACSFLCGVPSRPGHGNDDFGARSRFRFNGEPTVDRTYSFLHAHKSETAAPARLLYVEPDAGIFHFKPNLVAGAAEFHPESIGSAVLHCIVQSFLSDSKQAEGFIAGYGFRHIPRRKLNARLLLLAKLSAKASDRRRDAQVIKLRRMEFMRQKLNVACNLRAMQADFLQALPRSGV